MPQSDTTPPPTECPYCLEPIERTGSVVCGSCGTAHHSECWSENGGCCVRNCADARRSIDIDVEEGDRQALELTRDSVESARPYRPARASNPCMKCGRQVADGELYCFDCTPEPEENQDTRNTGPLLLMLALAGVVLAWILMATCGPVLMEAPATEETPAGAKTDR